MSSKWELSRRTVLRGVGAAVSLPLLDSMLPKAGLSRAAAAAGPALTKTPTRMCMMFLPNGMSIKDWNPSGSGEDWELSRTLMPLKDLKQDITVLSGLTLDNARAKGDGPGDHARSAAAFLTGAHPRKTAGSDIRLGVSMDQVAAAKVGKETRLPSLELGLDRVRTAGNCDSGYACAYVDNISWRSESTPMPKEVDPAALFERLFGSENDKAAAETRAKRLMYRKSILDFVSEDAKRLQRNLGSNDRRKLDEFTTAIREVEKRIEIARSQPAHDVPAPDYARPDGIPGDIDEHMKLMADLLALAFQMDITRVSTLMIARDGSNRSYHNLGISEGHHSLSHHGNNPEKVEQIRKIDEFHVAQFAYFVNRLKGIKEGEGTLLDNCMVMLGSGISDGNRHNHDELPVVMAGRGAGFMSPGRHVRHPRNTPLCNLYVSMLNHVGVKTESFGDSTGPLPNLTA